jgi:hypothetical protein
MKFQITRTSGGEGKPKVNGKFPLVHERYTRIDTRTVNDPAKIPAEHGSAWWYAEGINHRVEGGRIKRDFPDDAEGWFVEIETLDDLMRLVDRNGSIIVNRAWDNDSVRTIEIYDDYRE